MASSRDPKHQNRNFSDAKRHSRGPIALKLFAKSPDFLLSRSCRARAAAIGAYSRPDCAYRDWHRREYFRSLKLRRRVKHWISFDGAIVVSPRRIFAGSPALWSRDYKKNLNASTVHRLMSTQSLSPREN